MVVPVSAVPRIRYASGLCIIAAGVLLLSGCWGWIPEDPAAGVQAPAKPVTPPAAEAASQQQEPAADSAAAAGWYTVEAGDTLFSIAWRFRHQVRDLAAWNDLGDGSLILAGQRIRLSPPPGYSASESAATVAVASPAPRAAAGGGSSGEARPSSGSSASGAAASPRPAARSPASTSSRATGASKWGWPADGSVDASGARARPGDYGIRILGERGWNVVAADGGKVVYAGDGLKAYGLLVIVQHSPEWLSAYGHNEMILVREGDEVSAGQRIATMGMGPGNAAMLHFEIRQNGKPVEPIGLLPPRS